jgi:hypothetical protein
MKDIRQDLLYASSDKRLAFLGPRQILVTNMSLGFLPHPAVVHVRMLLWGNAKILPGG